MIELDSGNFGGVEWDCVFRSRPRQQVVLFDKKKFRLWIDKTFNQPGTGHAIHFDIASRNPLHGNLKGLFAFPGPVRCTTSKCVTESSKAVSAARASGSTTAFSEFAPANLRTPSIDSQSVSTTNSTAPPTARRSKYAPLCPSIAPSAGKICFVACSMYSPDFSGVARASHIRKIMPLPSV